MTLNKPINVNVQGNENTYVDVNVIIGKSYQYNDLLDQLNTQQKLFDRTPEDEIQERLEISGKINALNNQIEQFKQDVLKLAEAFQNIEINTDRLKRAKEHFDKGAIGEARAVLETEIEQMQHEQRHLLRERVYYEKETLPKLQNNSEEFYLLALSSRTDYTNPNRFDDVCKYFTSSIESYPTKLNILNYAYFLWEHNQSPRAVYYCELYLQIFKKEITKDEYATTLNNLAILHSDQNKYEEALKEYEEALQIYRQLSETNPQIYSPYVASTLNNLAILHDDQSKYKTALKEYEEALQIRRQLAEINPQTYLPYVAATLNNLAVLHDNENKYEEALKEYEEALQIYRQLSETNPQIYSSYVATTLNNLAVLHSNKDENIEASKEYEEALQIRRQLAEINPQTYLPYVANTLNNLAILHVNQNEYKEALEEYKEALQIKRRLFEKMPDVYSPKLSNLLKNISIFYQESLPDREKSIEYAVEAIVILLPVVEQVPYSQKYMKDAMTVLTDWDLNNEEIDKLIKAKQSVEVDN